MSKKKSKKPDNTNEDPSTGSTSSNIFKTIFGSIPEHHASLSIFSDNNPFRRKPSEPPNQKHQVGSGLGSAENVVNHTNGEDENLTFVEVKTRKRKKEEKKKHKLNEGSIDGTCETLLEIKKLKLGFDSDKDVGSHTNGEDDNIIDSKKRKRKNKEKRKYSLDSGSLDETSEGQLEIKKYKMGEPKSHTFGIEPEERGEGKVPNLGMELQALPKQGQGKNQILVMEAKGMDKKKKKRKKDEVETAYEAHRYGVGTNGEGAEEGLGGKVVGKKRKKIEDPVDMIPKEGFDDEAKLMRTVFVGNLPLKVKKKALLKEFSQFGDVESVRIRSVPLLDTKIPRKGAIIQKKTNDAVDSVNAYVVFKMEQFAQASLAHNMSVVGGNHIRVDMACPPRKKLKGENAPLYDNKRTVFVGNLPFDVKDEEVYQFFSGITELESSIEAIRVIRDPGTSLGKGIAYILFKTRGAANLIVKKRSLKLHDRELRLSHANSNISASKRKTNHSPWGTNDFSANKLAVGFRDPNTKSSTSYQGLRATKSGVQKKANPKNIVDAVNFNSRTQKGEKRVDGKRKKRPAVAARRANVLKASNQTRKKCKTENRTSQ